jgi:urea transport system permease protein
MTLFRSLLAALLIFCATAAHAVGDGELRTLVDALAADERSDVEAAITALASSGDERVLGILDLLEEGELYLWEPEERVVVGDRNGSSYTIADPVTGEGLGEVRRNQVDRISVNNPLRRAIAAARGGLTLMSDDPAVRRSAVDAVLRSRDAAAIPLLDTAIAGESDPAIRVQMERARAAAVLNSDFPEADKLAAIDMLASGGREAIQLLSPATSIEGEVGAAAVAAIDHINAQLALWSQVQNAVYGISLGSVLLLAAIGLAITFGVMGVINMAHGEMVMIGAYTTFVVQEAIRQNAPFLFDYSLLIALPLAFLVAGAIGVAIERGIIRWLYGRPLETLLATWGVSLILQQAVRTIFGASNRQVGNPSWMSGQLEFGYLTLTWSRLWIIVFSLVVFAGLLVVLKRTFFGLQMRAVTANRPMASAMGIRTPYVDALTFGLGSGIAGIAGVALSQIDNVSPNLGQGYIIDSFMVVVFGGVGNLWGTLVGAMTLGIANKFLEPYAGAVLGKILVLVLIILFIQKRPRGLFALKGRAVEA